MPFETAGFLLVLWRLPLQLINEIADDGEALFPKCGLGGVETEGGQEFLVPLGAARA